MVFDCFLSSDITLLHVTNVHTSVLIKYCKATEKKGSLATIEHVNRAILSSVTHLWAHRVHVFFVLFVTNVQNLNVILYPVMSRLLVCNALHRPALVEDYTVCLCVRVCVCIVFHQCTAGYQNTAHKQSWYNWAYINIKVLVLYICSKEGIEEMNTIFTRGQQQGKSVDSAPLFVGTFWGIWLATLRNGFWTRWAVGLIE